MSLNHVRDAVDEQNEQRTIGTGLDADYPTDIVTIKYDKEGNTLWTHSYPCDLNH